MVDDVRRAVLSFDDVRGRATRREFWTFVAAQAVSLALIVALYQLAWFFFWFYVAWFLVTVPSVLALAVRRVHDSGRSARWLLAALVPGIGLVVLAVLFVLPTDQTWNRYGPPRALASPSS